MKKLIGVLAIASVFSFVLMGCTPPVEGDTAPPPAGKDAPKTDTSKEAPKTDIQTPTAPTTG
jgi:hypothetical protein